MTFLQLIELSMNIRQTEIREQIRLIEYELPVGLKWNGDIVSNYYTDLGKLEMTSVRLTFSQMSIFIGIGCSSRSAMPCQQTAKQ